MCGSGSYQRCRGELWKTLCCCKLFSRAYSFILISYHTVSLSLSLRFKLFYYMREANVGWLNLPNQSKLVAKLPLRRWESANICIGLYILSNSLLSSNLQFLKYVCFLTSLPGSSVCSSYPEGLGVWTVAQVPQCTPPPTTCVYQVHHRAECPPPSQDSMDSSIPPWCSLSYRDRSGQPPWSHSVELM